MHSHPLDDSARLEALHAADLLDSAAEEAFDRFTCLAVTILDDITERLRSQRMRDRCKFDRFGTGSNDQPYVGETQSSP